MYFTILVRGLADELNKPTHAKFWPRSLSVALSTMRDGVYFVPCDLRQQIAVLS